MVSQRRVINGTMVPGNLHWNGEAAKCMDAPKDVTIAPVPHRSRVNFKKSTNELNRAVRMLASGTFGLNFLSAASTVGGN
ncbi:hypothetical protein KIN20_014928 [Parelaphostrongylus tenuis]|uniref:Uncharacterized protein n=1 Tax=Parelaphostrongylus tenuis TaxID=148309 RepID=A0AAD5ME42_PARTN|nr:hypothetical protein KIN20_014928 [Parelaphostrongylus tenuis]